MKKSWIRTAALCAAVGIGSAALAEEPAKLNAGMRSANSLLADLEYLVVKLAKDKATQDKQKAIFEKDIKPNIEIFLIGVNAKLPVGASFLFSAETGQRKLMQIPVELIADFINDNLVPIGIDASKDRKDKTLYELTGTAFTGWMRAEGNNKYASISEQKSDVPAGVVTPEKSLNDLFVKGFDFAFTSLNTEAEAKTRTAAFQKQKEKQVADLKKKTDESPEAFDLRKLVLTQRVDTFGRLFSQTHLLEGGWATDEAKKMGLGQSHWTAMPNTGFSQWIAKLEATKSHFASLSGSDKSVFTAHILFPISDGGQVNLKEVYKLSPMVLKQTIEADKDLKPEEKAARIGVADAGLEALNKGLELGVVDMFVDIAPSEGKLHTFVLGMRSADIRGSMETLVGHLGKVRTGWSSKVNIETIGEFKYHSFTVNNAPKVMLDFYGGDGTVYVATGPDFVGFATGVGSLDVLKKLSEQATTGEKKAPEAFVDVRFHARESLAVTHAFLAEKDFDLLRLLQGNGLKKGTPEPKVPATEKPKKPASDEKNDKLSTLQNFDWEQTAIDAMLGTDDLVTMQIKLVNGALDSETKLGEGVLTSMGAVFAKFAKENLGGN